MPRHALSTGLAVALCGVLVSIVPRVLEIEEQLGLAVLFGLRPAPPPPDSVVVVAIGSETADHYGLSSYLFEWPRRYHAEVVRKLAAAGAAAIVFDIAFQRQGDPRENEAFAAAIRDAGNVLLHERIQIRDQALPGLDDRARQITRIPIVETLARAALGRAPFTLPTFPIRTSQFWVFGAAASDTPMLPTVAVQARLRDRLDDLIGLILEVSPESSDSLTESDGATAAGDALEIRMRELRRAFLSDPGLHARLTAALESQEMAQERRDQLLALVSLYSGPDSRYLNFYGPNGSITTFRYEDVLDGDPDWPRQHDLSGKVVFVGYSTMQQSEQQDEFVSVFSQRTGLSPSGVEIGATAYANLWHRNWIEPLPIPWHLALLFFFGTVSALALGTMRLRHLLPAGLLLAGLYLGAAVLLFDRLNVWVPLVVPIGLQIPLILAGLTLWHYRTATTQRGRIQVALGRFVPPTEVERLVHETLEPSIDQSVVHGTCLVTDIERYTALAERLEPAELATLMQRYFEALSEIVRSHGGFVADVSGDSMVGVWTAATDDPGLRRKAIGAALDIVAARTEFGIASGHCEVMTATGLESGPIALRQYARGEQYVYRAVGDIVNTASRIQGLNRLLATRVLLSRDADCPSVDWRIREVGRFLFLGKQTPIDVSEALPADDARTEQLASLLGMFAGGLADFRAGHFDSARRRFESILASGVDDGPSRFYIQQSELCSRKPPPRDWDGAIRLATK